MADTETDASAQLRDPTPSTTSCTTTFAQSMSVPTDVVEAINKSGDLVPALFALPCESDDTKKLKLCKRVGWLRDGVFTTGYMKINGKEAKQKGIFNRPRRVTMVKREDSGFQSTEVGEGSKAPTSNQLSSVMLRRNTSTTALVNIKGELVPNTIVVDKDSVVISEEISEKLVALNSRDFPMAARSEEKHTVNLEVEASNKTTEKQKLGGNSRDPNRQELDNNNTFKPSEIRGCMQMSLGTQGVLTESSRDNGDPLTATDYFLTEEDKAFPIKRKSSQESSQDYPATPASQTLQHLMQIAGADRKESNSKYGDSPASTEKQVHTNASAIYHSSQTRQSQTASASSEESLPPQRRKSQDAQPPERPKLNKVVDQPVPMAVENDNTAKPNPKCDVLKLDIAVTLSAGETPVTLPSRVQRKTQKIEGPDKRTKLPEAPPEMRVNSVTTQGSIVPSPVDGDFLTNDCKITLPNLNKKRATHIDHTYGSSSLTPLHGDSTISTNGRTHLEHSYSSRTNPIEALLNTTVPTSASSEVKSANLGGVACDASKSDSPFDEVSDGVPTLRIGSVYSLSEKEAQEMFPNSTKPPKPAEKPVNCEQEIDQTNSPNLKANLGITVRNEPINASQAQATNIGSQIQSSGNATGTSQNASTLPFSNSSSVKLYNITPLKGSPSKKAVCTPVTTVTLNPPANLAQSSFIFSVPSSSSTVGAQPQQPVHSPASQLYTLIPPTQAPICPNQSQLVSLVPIQVGTLQGTTVSAPRAVPVFSQAAVRVIPRLSTHLPVRLSKSTTATPLKPRIPAELNQPVVTAIPCSKIVVTRVIKEAPLNAQTTVGTNASEVGKESKTIPMPTCVIPKTSQASGVPESGRTVISSSETPTGQPSQVVLAGSTGSVTVKKTVIIRERSTAPTTKAKETPSTKPSKSGTEPKPSERPGANPVTHGPRKTFLITTSNGEKRLVSLPGNAEAASVLTQMASKKAFQCVVPQKAADEMKTEIKKENRKEKRNREHTPSNHSPKKSKKSRHKHSHKSRHKTKKRLPVLKIKFRKEPKIEPKEEPQEEADVRRSPRDKQLKRPYSPPNKGSKKVCRSKTLVIPSEETELSPNVKDTEESRLPFIKTEPVSPDISDGEDALPPKPPSPPTYVDRDDRVKRLKEIMKEKEKALVEILSRRKKELQERLADPELCDL